eukprot:CAMPEP_0177304086 /NCGR_PEP_ID=MMETSP0368-20130122/6473_1 /TAXON_ID=447022 ORGANISM="Scrippsiella hangoei-like, Strain SHHI-4" /NCGR_SAMPLE_ID=MMETSP0368 /ASSEMBLY_ACC=CAM_ASM_000363 /LENGTH=964 /DNA_ID=CAMNT_0018762665 /DNA_START=115 /DNA_END=3005 /DNA_ORIENTATION=+
MVLAEALGLSAGVSTLGIFDYNRKNFMFDRQQRQRQELQVVNFRLEQVDMWREDVRDMIGLTEKRMDVYIFVNALQIGVNLALYTEGRLEMGTPQWLIWCYVLCLTGSTPIPSWEMIESMRTYGAGFEGNSLKTMFRIPLLQTVSEGFNGGTGTAGMASTRSFARADEDNDAMAADPWGLERQGSQISELQFKPLPGLPHARMVRDSARHWQAYDAFARVAMNLGTILQCQALSYYIIGYVILQDGSPWAAFCTMACFLSVASTLLKLDVSMTAREFRIARFFLCGGPGLACVAVVDWATYDDVLIQAAIVVLPLCFSFHGLFLLYFFRVIRAASRPGGAVLPTSFRSVTYLDIYGWLRRRPKEKSVAQAPMTMRSLQRAAVQERLLLEANSDASSSSSAAAPAVSSWAPSLRGFFVARFARLSSGASRASSERPAMRKMSSLIFDKIVGGRSEAHLLTSEERKMSIVHGMNFPRNFGTENPRPLRPEDIERELCEEGDLLGSATALDEARDVLEEVEGRTSSDDDCDGRPKELPGVGPPGIVPGVPRSGRAFAGTSFTPAKPDEDEEEVGDEVTGRDIYDAGELPYHVLRRAVWLLIFLWFAGAVWSVAQILHVPDIPVKNLPTSVSLSREDVRDVRGLTEELPDLEGYRDLHLEQQIYIQWPSQSFQPWGISTDESGKHFAISDEFQLYSASLLTSGDGLRLTGFHLQPRCAAIEGQAVRDIAVACDDIPGTTDQGKAPACKALVLIERGLRLAECDLVFPMNGAGAGGHAGAAEEDGKVWNISTKWLRADGTFHNDLISEELISAAIDSDCSTEHATGSGESACVVVGTNHGRIVRLRRSLDKEGELVPADVLWNVQGTAVKPEIAEVWATSMLQTLPGGYLLALRDGRRSVHAMHMATRKVVGRWRLPRKAGRTWTALAGGASHVYITSQDDHGGSAELWRIRLPKALTTHSHDAFGGPT